MTRRNLADVVVAADRVGVALKGIVVANPDPLDRTTGRLTPLERPGSSQQAPPRTTATAGTGASGTCTRA